MAGLIAEQDGGESASTTGGDQAFSTTDAGGGPSGESHLDSFIASSGWSREDLMLVLMLLQTTLLIAWYVEVRDA